ncbi:hypothetical protein [Rhizobium sp. AG855]|uniref:hypothetical protein n=1 Tax=Rhizobium sp. AG855 TaxID=2183898 RepID=UPI0011C43F88|nr:hypothetical protein [Rhizobium sp. AG855]
MVETLADVRGLFNGLTALESIAQSRYNLSDRRRPKLSEKNMEEWPRFKPLILGELPVQHLRRFGLNLQPGPVGFSIPAQKHAFKSHPDSFMSCLPFLTQTVARPTHVGQSPKHTNDGLELIREVRQLDLILLVALLIRPTRQGVYMVKSTYPIDRNKLENRLRKGHLIETQ